MRLTDSGRRKTFKSVYQIITDNFFDGDAFNNNADHNYNPANSGQVPGGDFQGIEQKLDYINYIKVLGARRCLAS